MRMLEQKAAFQSIFKVFCSNLELLKEETKIALYTLNNAHPIKEPLLKVQHCSRTLNLNCF